MPTDTDAYLAIKGHVVCIEKATGAERWRTKIKRGSVTTLSDAGDLVLAYGGGHLFGLDKADGRILWENTLPGLGHSYCIIAGASAEQAATAAIAAAIQAAQSSSAAAAG